MTSKDSTSGGQLEPRVNVLGTEVSAVDMAMVLDSIAASIAARNPEYICVVPAHTVMDCRADPALRRIVNASRLATPDGMSIVWLLKLLGYRGVERVYGPDLLLETCRYGLSRDWGHFFYGGKAGVADALAIRLADQYPSLRVTGKYTPPFRPLTSDEDREVIKIINNSGADIIWIGLSSPKQEYWMAEHRSSLDAPIMIGVGAAFDFIAGTKPQAPRWIQHSGFEWLFRLLSEPRRLWPRYRQYPKFVLLVLAQLMGLKKYPNGG